MSAIDDPSRGRIAFDGTRTPLKTALFLLVCVAWVLRGLVGHDPWKSDEAVVFGAVTQMLRTGAWLSFHIAGEPFFDKAPLFLWVAAGFAKLFGAILPVHDAARLASGFFMACTLALLSLTSLELIAHPAMPLGLLPFIPFLRPLIP